MTSWRRLTSSDDVSDTEDMLLITAEWPIVCAVSSFTQLLSTIKQMLTWTCMLTNDNKDLRMNWSMRKLSVLTIWSLPSTKMKLLNTKLRRISLKKNVTSTTWKDGLYWLKPLTTASLVFTATSVKAQKLITCVGVHQQRWVMATCLSCKCFISRLVNNRTSCQYKTMLN